MGPEEPRHLRPENAEQRRNASRARLIGSLTDPFSWLSVPPVLAIAWLAARATGLMDVSTAAFVVVMALLLLATPVALVALLARRKRTGQR